MGDYGEDILSKDEIEKLNEFIKKNDGRMKEYLKGLRFEDVNLLLYY